MDYYASAVQGLRFLTGNIELPGALVVIGLVVVLCVRHRRRAGQRTFTALAMQISLWAGVVWAGLTLIYIRLVNPEYANILGQRAVPAHAQGAETTVLPAVVTFIHEPVVQFIWKIGISCLWGAILSVVLTVVYSKRFASDRQPQQSMTDKPFVRNGWEVEGIRQADAFFDALVEFLPLPTYLCFEGTSIAPDVRALLEANAVAPAMNIATGTLWPKPSVFHVLPNELLLRRLATLARHHAEPEICDHFHAYQDGHGLLQWYDAFNDPLLVDETIAEAAVQQLCSKLGVPYSQRQAG